MKEQPKFKITIIDFMLENGKHFVGKDKNNNNIYVGDMVIYNGETNWFVAYRYGEFVIKQVGVWFMVIPSNWSIVEKQNVIGSGPDYLIIGYVDEPFYEKIKHVI